MLLQTDRLILRPWKDEDRELFAAMNVDPEVMRYLFKILDEKESDELVDRFRQEYDRRGYAMMAVQRIEDGRFLVSTGIAAGFPMKSRSAGVWPDWFISCKATIPERLPAKSSQAKPVSIQALECDDMQSMKDTIAIRPIKREEWLPDRCLNGSEPFDPVSCQPESGCPSINFSQKNDRKSLEELYRSTIDKYGGCGFVAWDCDKIIAYHSFFPLEIAQKIKFYGYGSDSIRSEKILIHNCLTIVKGNDVRKGIGTRLVKTSIDWAKTNGWNRFEVHMVLPDCERGWQSHQKSCLTFWKRLGFEVFEEHESDSETKEYYGVTKRFSMCLLLDQSMQRPASLND